MQNPHAPHETSNNAGLLHALCEEIEIAWNARRDAVAVDRLAADHPDLSGALYEFFALLIQAELDLDQAEPALAEHDARARQRLEAGGYAEAAEIARRDGTFASRTDLELPVPGAGAEQRTPAPTPDAALDQSAAPAPPAGAPAEQADRPAGDPPEVITPAAASPAAGVPTASAGRGAVSPSGRMGRRPQRRNFLGLLIDATSETPDMIAAGLGISASLLVSVDDLADRLPVRAREELARRGAVRYGLSREQLLEHLGESGPLARAASRGAGYDRTLTYQDVVRRSKLSPADEAFWLSLAD